MLRGVYAALITPFDKRENIDEKGAKPLFTGHRQRRHRRLYSQ